MSELAFSYRNDPQVPRFPDDKPVLFFDGVCVLCSGFANFVLHHDRDKRMRLCAAQSPLGQAVYRHYGLDPKIFDTNLLLAGGRVFTKSDAFIETMSILGGPWSSARALHICPQRVRNYLYDPIARNRYRWFGERDSCYLPAPSEKDRFLP